MEIGIRLHDTIEGTLEERLAFARKQGFTCAHLALSKAIPNFAMQDAPVRLTEEFADTVRNAFSRTGMRCVLLGCYLNLANPDEEERARTQDIYRAHLRFARMSGADAVGTETYAHPGSAYTPSAAQSEEAFQFFLESLKPVLETAEEENVPLAVEPVYHHIISTPERAERMLESLHSDALRIILDAVNLISPAQAESPTPVVEDAIRRLGSRVCLLHMKDYLPEGDPMKAVACGLGRMRYESLLRFAKKQALPMTLENTVPENAEQARLFLEHQAEGL